MTSPSNATVRQERDVVPPRVVYGGAAVLTGILLVGGLLTWIGMRHVPIHTGFAAADAPVTIVPREIEMIDQTLFAAHEPSRGHAARTGEALRSYEWIDQPRGLLRIPVERAMEMIVERGHVE